MKPECPVLPDLEMTFPGPLPTRPRLALRDAAKGVYCQMYYWGRDVMHPDGNLLVKFGFERLAKTTKEGTSRYRLLWKGGLLELHGFCAGWYPEGGPGICFDRKHDTWHLWTAPEPPDPAALLKRRINPSDLVDDPILLLRHSARFIRWIVEYETYAIGQWGVAARQQQHRDFTKLLSRRRWLAPEPSLAWLAAYAADPLSAPRPRKITAPGAWSASVRPAPAGCSKS